MDKQQQKQLITEIMNDDAKDGLYKQQTAVQWIERQIDFDMSWTEIMGLIRQAKQMEREQIRCAYHVGLYDSSMQQEKRFDNGLDYYTQTYGE